MTLTRPCSSASSSELAQSSAWSRDEKKTRHHYSQTDRKEFDIRQSRSIWHSRKRPVRHHVWNSQGIGRSKPTPVVSKSDDLLHFTQSPARKIATIKMKTYDPKKYHIGKVVNGYVCLICPLCDSLLIEAIGNVRFGSVICGQCCINGNEKTLHFYRNIDGLYSLQVDK
jgi:hypothetical protein